MCFSQTQFPRQAGMTNRTKWGSSRATIVAKEKGVVAGIEVARAVFAKLDPTLKTAALLTDGETVDRTDAVIAIEGPARSILTAERTALNFLQRLSGIATQTRRRKRHHAVAHGESLGVDAGGTPTA